MVLRLSVRLVPFQLWGHKKKINRNVYGKKNKERLNDEDLKIVLKWQQE